MKFDRILVALDFSPASLAALRRARALANPGAEIRLLHVLEESARAERLSLETFAEELRVGDFQVVEDLRPGRPADEIVAASQAADLVCMGTHGRGRVGRLILGSVADEVVRRSATPVLVVREGQGEVTGRVIVAVDPVGPSRDAIRAARDLARRLSARLEAIHVIDTRPTVTPAAEAIEVRSRSSSEQVRAILAKALDRAIPIRLVVGAPGRAILRAVKTDDLLVCSTHAREGVDRLFLGSVAGELASQAPCPVLVVRPQGQLAPAEPK